MAARLASDPQDRIVLTGQAVTIALDPATFSGVTGSTTYAAQLTGGGALPSWLTLNSATGQLSVAAGAPAGGYDVLITATDGGATSAPAVQTIWVAQPVALQEALSDRAFVANTSFAFSVPTGAFSVVGGTASQEHIKVLGAIDSLTEGYGGSSYSDTLMARMRGLYDDGGPGYQAFTSSSSVTSASGRVQYLSGPSSNPGLEKYSINGRGIDVTGADGRDMFSWDPKKAWDSATIYYLQQPDGGTMTVRGAGAGDVITVNTAGPLMLKSITVHSDRGQADSSVTISGMNGHLTVFGADFGLDQDGASFSNIGIGGTSLTNWSLLDSDFRRQWFAALSPDVYILNAGMNDRGQLSGAQYKALVAAILDDFAAASPNTKIILEGPNDVGSSGQDYLAAFRTALQQLAVERGLTYVDDTVVLGNYAAAAAAGYMFDLIHPNATGNQLRASALLTADGIDPSAPSGATDTFLDGSTPGITYSAAMADGSALPSWLTFDSSTGQFSAGSGSKPTGVYSIRVTATGPDGSVSTDVFDLRLASDTSVTGTTAGETINGDIGADVLSGGGGNDTLLGLDGADTLDGGAGADILNGGAGIDLARYSGSPTGVTVNLTTGLGSGGDAEGDTLTNIENIVGSAYNDVLTGDSLNNDITGGSGDDQLFGNLGRDTLRGGIGNDSMDGGGGADFLIGGTGNDTYVVDNVGDQITEAAGEGTDTVLSSVSLTLLTNVENLTLTGTAALNGTGNALDNVIVGNGAANALNGLDGNDQIAGGGGNDTIDGGIGNDIAVFSGARANYVVTQQSGGALQIADQRTNAPDGVDAISNVEVFRFSDRDYTLAELTGTPPPVDTTPPTLSITTSDNQLTAGETGLLTFQFSEAVTGFTASDIAVQNGTISNFTTVNSTTFTAVFTPTGNFTGTGSATVAAGSYADAAGNAGGAGQLSFGVDTTASGKVITGTSGNDSLRGTGTNDTLYGLGGNDTLNSGAGADTMYGGLGDDVYYAGVGDTVIEQAGEGTDWINTSISFTLAANVENMTLLGAAAINGTGNELANVINGNDAANIITTLDGDDQLRGNGGDDVLMGGAGNDYLSGGDGVDQIIGGAGVDLMYGGNGADTFVFQSLSDFASGSSLDQIGVFSAAEGDKIDLTAIDANSLVAGVQAFTFIGTAAFSGVAGQLRYQSIGGGNLRVDADLNGDKAVDFSFNVGASALTASDFVVATDTTPPTVQISAPDTQLTASETALVTFQFSEAVTGFTLSDLAADHGTFSNFTTVSANTYTAVFTPQSGYAGPATLSIAGGSYTDLANNAGGAGQLAVTIDNAAPTVALSTSDASLTTGETAQITIQFNEAVVGFDINDLSSQTGQLSGFTAVNAQTYTVIFTPAANASAQGGISITAGGYTDVAGNAGPAAQAPLTVDTIPPSATVAASDANLTQGETSLLTITFNEAVTGFALGDLVATNGTLSNFTAQSASVYTVTFTPTADFDGVGTVSFAAGSYTDQAGNAGAAGQTSLTINTHPVDATPPSLAITSNDGLLTTGETALLTFQFSETVTGFTASDVSVQNGALSGFTAIDGDTYTAVFTPTANFQGSGPITVAAGSYADVAGNAGGAGSASVSIDTRSGDATSPTLAITSSDALLTAGETALLTFKFSEAVTGFTASDVTLQSGQISGFTAVDAQTFTAVYTPASSVNGQVGVSVAAGAYADTAANLGDAGQLSLAVNTTGQAINGTSGADNLRGLGGADTLFGFGGNDVLNSGSGADTMYGGAGDDVYYVNVGDTVVELSGEGTDWINSTVTFALTPNVENMTLLGATAINGTGNELANVINGNDAANVMTGLDGDDQLRSNGGDDQLLGGAGNDYLSGGNGADTLIGGSGADLMYGGAGADVFVFQSLADFATGSNLDQIGAFTASEGDKIDLGAIDANPVLAGDQAFAFLGTAAFTGAAGQLRYQSIGGGNLRVDGDLNGDKVADFAFYAAASSLSASDFVL